LHFKARVTFIQPSVFERVVCGGWTFLRGYVYCRDLDD